MRRVSIVICTRNRAPSLARTLTAIGAVALPAGSRCEILVVNNASTDDTEEVASRALPANGIPVRHVSEPVPGVARARNTGLAAADGDLIAFLDDDQIPDRCWLEKLCAPILSGQAEAVTGGIRLAPHLDRPWMSACHRAWLASSEELDNRNPSRMISANMALSREVLGRVPGFDTELGIGALGFGEDTLFSLQLRQAGYRIAGAFDATAEHHFDEKRLTTASWLRAARDMGRTDAYLAYHWENSDWVHPWRNVLKAALRRVCQRAPAVASSGVSESLLHTTRNLHANLQYLRERKRPRNYTRHGLVKLATKPCP